MIQFLIKPSATNAKLEQTCKLQKCYKNFNKVKFKNDLHKISWKEHCSNPDSNVALRRTFSANNKNKLPGQTCSIHTLCQRLALLSHPNLG